MWMSQLLGVTVLIVSSDSFCCELSPLEMNARFSPVSACSQCEVKLIDVSRGVLGCVGQMMAFFMFNGNTAPSR